MENQEVKITVEEGVKELIIRNGEAEKLFPPVAVKISGSITAPGNFIAVRKPDAQEAHVTFSRSNMEIVYYEGAIHPISPVVAGKLIINPDLEKFNINAQKTSTLKELAQFVKMNRLFFSNKDVCAEIVTKLNSFSATITTEVDKHQDTRGNSRQMQDKKVVSNVPLIFILDIPVFLGFKAKRFEVEVCLDSTDVGTRVWLESAELQELILKERDEIMDIEISRFEALDLVVIEQY